MQLEFDRPDARALARGPQRSIIASGRGLRGGRPPSDVIMIMIGFYRDFLRILLARLQSTKSSLAAVTSVTSLENWQGNVSTAW